MKVDIKVKEKNIHGIRVVHIKNSGSLMSYVAFHCMSGSFAENKKNQGVAHYLEHMFFKGTTTRSYEDIVDEAALMGAKQNAYTGGYDTCYFLTTPSANYPKAIELLSDQMFNSTFSEDEMNKERSVIQAERKSYDDSPHHDFYAKLESCLFNFQTGHPIIGTEKTIDNLTRQDLIDYYENNYGSNNVVLFISAPVKSKEVFRHCHDMLSGNPFKEIKKAKIKTPLIKNYIDTNVTRHGIQQTHMSLIFQGTPLDYKNKASHECLLTALGGGMSSVLFKRIREELGLCYSINASGVVKNPKEGLDHIYTLLDADKAQLAKDEIMKIIHNLSLNGFDEKSFNCAKAKMLAKICRVLSDPDNLSGPLAKSKLWVYDFDIQKQYDMIDGLTYKKFNKYTMEHLTKVFYGYDKHSCWFTMNPED